MTSNNQKSVDPELSAESIQAALDAIVSGDVFDGSTRLQQVTQVVPILVADLQILTGPIIIGATTAPVTANDIIANHFKAVPATIALTATGVIIADLEEAIHSSLDRSSRQQPFQVSRRRW